VQGHLCGAATWTTERIDSSAITSPLADLQPDRRRVGVTRNAVIGKIHRMGLSPSRPRGRPAALAQRMGSARTQPRRPPTRIARLLRAFADATTVTPFDTSLVTAEMAPVDSARRCSLLDLSSGNCRWPLGDPGKHDFGFCGNDAIAGISYCAGHARLAYRLPSGRRA
jgi:GcrA cell cycle regulator